VVVENLFSDSFDLHAQAVKNTSERGRLPTNLRNGPVEPRSKVSC
jgi:hypothetical protein